MSDSQWFKNSQASKASYADLATGNILLQDNVEGLENVNWVSAEIASLAENFDSVVTQYTDNSSTADAGLDTGFSVTVFQNADENKITIAFRGTSDLQDFVVTDAAIAFSGAGYDQIVAMYNWWQRESNPAGAVVPQFDVINLRKGTQPSGSVPLEDNLLPEVFIDYLVPIETAVATGALDIVNGATPPEISLTGHSLGGHLALAFNSMFFGVGGEIYTFNAPGFVETAINVDFFNALGGVVPGFLNGTTATTTNLQGNEVGFGDPGFDAIAGLFFEVNSQGDVIEIPIEDQAFSDEPQPEPSRNHSIAQLADSLAAFELLRQLSPGMGESIYDSVFQIASNEEFRSHEFVVNGLLKLFKVQNSQGDVFPQLLGGNFASSRNGYYEAIKAISENDEYKTAVSDGIVVLDPTGNGLLAESNFGVFLSIQLLTPFAFSGAEGVFSALYPEMYSAWTDGEFSPNYIADRTLMYEALIQRNKDDEPFPDPINGESLRFFDSREGEVFAGGNNSGQGGSNTVDPNSVTNIVFGDNENNFNLTGRALNDRLYGLNGADFLSGGDGDDRLEGGKGEDILKGGAGNDQLIGGTGSDVYLAGDGDIISDSDGIGFVYFNDVRLMTGSRVDTDPEGQYSSDDDRFGFQLVNGTLSVTDNNTAGVLTIEDYDISSSSLGISLSDEQTDNGGFNVINGTESDDDLNGTVGRDEIRGLGGDDNIDGFPGDDLLIGGDGEDVINGEGGDDELEGGADIDVLMGKEGIDTLSGGPGVDFLFGGSGDDALFGDAGSDFLAGGDGIDTLVGGDGTDILYGDASEVGLVGRGNSLSIINPGTIDIIVEHIGFSLNFVEPADQPAGAGPGDLLFGGAGDDVLSGGVGDDVLSGEADDDVLAGGSHNDFLSGGAGRDIIFGDETFEVPSVVPGKDTILGGGGNDLIVAGMNDDTVFGGSGDDVIHGDDLNDSAVGDNDFISGDDGNDTVFAGAGDDIVLGGAGTDTLIGGLGNDQIDGGEDDDQMDGLEGNDVLTGGAGNDLLLGGADDDFLDGGAGDDDLQGGDGNDVLIGGEGTDTLTGGAGADVLESGRGNAILDGGDDNDVYIISFEATSVEISQSGGADTLQLSGNFGLDDLTLNRQNGDLQINAGSTLVTFSGWGDGFNSTFKLSENTTIDNAEFDPLINDAPEVGTAIQNQTARADSEFNFQIDSGSFVDEDDATLEISAVLPDDSPLPGWLTFDEATATFTGTPTETDIGTLDIKVNARDANGLLVSQTFSLVVDEALINTPPELAFEIPNRSVGVGLEFNFAVPNGSFVDADEGDSLTYTATLDDDSPLPSWLNFDPDEQRFTGTPASGDIGEVNVKVTATDQSGESASDEFKVTVANSSDQDVVSVITNEGLGQVGLGNTISSVGDINGDGFDDVYIGSVKPASEVEENQRLDIFLGRGEFYPPTFGLGEPGSGVSSVGFTELAFGDFFSTREAIALGDINADGFSDFAFASTERSEAGASIILGAGSFPNRALDEFPGASAFRVFANDNQGRLVEVRAVGDINNDGFDDFIYGAFANPEFGGEAGFGGEPEVDASEPNTLVLGRSGIGSGSGATLSSIFTLDADGDFNGDGRNDPVFINTDFEAYIVLEEISNFSSIPTFNNLGNTESLRFSTNQGYGDVGYIGDFNGDGLDDILVYLTTSFDPEVYVIFGQEDASTLADIDVNSLNGSNGFVLQFPDFFVRQVVAGSDLDGDGQTDILIVGEGPSETIVGTVVFGRSDGFGGSFNVTNIDSSTGFDIVFAGEAGVSAASIGADLNADGFNDIVLGDPRVSSLEVDEAGEAYVIYGRDFRQLADYVGDDGNNLIVADEDGFTGYGLGGDDTIEILPSIDVFVNAGGGNDTINVSGIGSAQINGGTGNDTYRFDLNKGNSPFVSFDYGITTSPQASQFFFQGNAPGTFSISGNSRGNSLSVDSGSGGLQLGQGSIRITLSDKDYEIVLRDFDPNDVLNGPRNIDTFIFNDGVLTYEEVVALGFDQDGTQGDDILTGTNVVDRINGLDGSDQILAGDGNDVLTGDAGNDHLDGGGGDDQYNFHLGDGQDLITDIGGADVVNFGSGIVSGDLTVEQQGDDLRVQYSATDEITIQGWFLDPSNQIEQFAFADDPSATLSASDVEALIGGQTELNLITGTAGANVLNGTEQADQIEGLAGNDTIFGAGGDDVIIGGDGNDDLNGDTGNDTFIIEGISSNHDTVNGGDGIDTVLGSDSDDTFRFLTFRNDKIVEVIDGGLGFNIIAGTNGANVIDLSNTTLVGIAEIHGENGNDNITGSVLADIIVGGAGNDTLNGGDGDDTFIIEGISSNHDTITGGAGSDTVLGGDGDDVFRFLTFRDDKIVEVIDGGLGFNIIAGTNGANVIDLSNTTLVGIAEIHGENGNDNITGSVLADIIVGGAGNDTLNGGDGDDTFIIEGISSNHDTVIGGDGIDTVLGGEGDDTFRFLTFRDDKIVEVIDGGLGFNIIAGTNGANVIDLSNTTLVGIAEIHGENGNDNITGSVLADIIVGGAGNDTLNGGDGDDTFIIEGISSNHDTVIGGDGIDTVLGGEGDDTFRFLTFRDDKIVEVIDGGLGFNIIAGTSGANVIDLSNTTLVGIAEIHGEDGNDNITGSVLADIIVGGAGNDTLNGGDGDDTFIIEGISSNHDTVIGGDGIDTVLGGEGDDTFRFLTFRDDKIVEVIDGGLGFNIIAGTSGANVIDLSNTTLVGIAEIHGEDGNDNITGSILADIIVGGAGNDTLKGGAGGDTYLVNPGHGRDTIEESGLLDDEDVLGFGGNISFENLWFTQQGDNLVIGQIGLEDELTIRDWFVNDGFRIETIQTNQAVLSSEDVLDLVNAMAGIADPTGAGGSLSSEDMATIQPVIDNAWLLI